MSKQLEFIKQLISRKGKCYDVAKRQKSFEKELAASDRFQLMTDASQPGSAEQPPTAAQQPPGPAERPKSHAGRSTFAHSAEGGEAGPATLIRPISLDNLRPVQVLVWYRSWPALAGRVRVRRASGRVWRRFYSCCRSRRCQIDYDKSLGGQRQIGILLGCVLVINWLLLLLLLCILQFTQTSVLPKPVPTRARPPVVFIFYVTAVLANAFCFQTNLLPPVLILTFIAPGDTGRSSVPSVSVYRAVREDFQLDLTSFLDAPFRIGHRLENPASSAHFIDHGVRVFLEIEATVDAHSQVLKRDFPRDLLSANPELRVAIFVFRGLAEEAGFALPWVQLNFKAIRPAADLIQRTLQAFSDLLGVISAAPDCQVIREAAVLHSLLFHTGPTIYIQEEQNRGAHRALRETFLEASGSSVSGSADLEGGRRPMLRSRPMMASGDSIKSSEASPWTARGVRDAKPVAGAEVNHTGASAELVYQHLEAAWELERHVLLVEGGRFRCRFVGLLVARQTAVGWDPTEGDRAVTGRETEKKVPTVRRHAVSLGQRAGTQGLDRAQAVGSDGDRRGGIVGEKEPKGLADGDQLRRKAAAPGSGGYAVAGARSLPLSDGRSPAVPRAFADGPVGPDDARAGGQIGDGGADALQLLERRHLAGDQGGWRAKVASRAWETVELAAAAELLGGSTPAAPVGAVGIQGRSGLAATLFADVACPVDPVRVRRRSGLSCLAVSNGLKGSSAGGHAAANVFGVFGKAEMVVEFHPKEDWVGLKGQLFVADADIEPSLASIFRWAEAERCCSCICLGSAALSSARTNVGPRREPVEGQQGAVIGVEAGLDLRGGFRDGLWQVVHVNQPEERGDDAPLGQSLAKHSLLTGGAAEADLCASVIDETVNPSEKADGDAEFAKLTDEGLAPDPVVGPREVKQAEHCSLSLRSVEDCLGDASDLLFARSALAESSLHRAEHPAVFEVVAQAEVNHFFGDFGYAASQGHWAIAAGVIRAFSAFGYRDDDGPAPLMRTASREPGFVNEIQEPVLAAGREAFEHLVCHLVRAWALSGLKGADGGAEFVVSAFPGLPRASSAGSTSAQLLGGGGGSPLIALVSAKRSLLTFSSATRWFQKLAFSALMVASATRLAVWYALRSSGVLERSACFLALLQFLQASVHASVQKGLPRLCRHPRGMEPAAARRWWSASIREPEVAEDGFRWSSARSSSALKDVQSALAKHHFALCCCLAVVLALVRVKTMGRWSLPRSSIVRQDVLRAVARPLVHQVVSGQLSPPVAGLVRAFAKRPFLDAGAPIVVGLVVVPAPVSIKITRYDGFVGSWDVVPFWLPKLLALVAIWGGVDRHELDGTGPRDSDSASGEVELSVVVAPWFVEGDVLADQDHNASAAGSALDFFVDFFWVMAAVRPGVDNGRSWRRGVCRAVGRALLLLRLLLVGPGGFLATWAVEVGSVGFRAGELAAFEVQPLLAALALDTISPAGRAGANRALPGRGGASASTGALDCFSCCRFRLFGACRGVRGAVRWSGTRLRPWAVPFATCSSSAAATEAPSCLLLRPSEAASRARREAPAVCRERVVVRSGSPMGRGGRGDGRLVEEDLRIGFRQSVLARCHTVPVRRLEGGARAEFSLLEKDRAGAQLG
uniref:PI3K/PI4K domain-containing protein n=1 Tax=Macrostomum lignano TaxID=282301 RepID=A0A1I8HDT0_9PLAT